MNQENEELITISEAAVVLGTSKNTARRLIQHNDIAVNKLTRTFKVKRADIEQITEGSWGTLD